MVNESIISNETNNSSSAAAVKEQIDDNSVASVLPYWRANREPSLQESREKAEASQPRPLKYKENYEYKGFKVFKPDFPVFGTNIMTDTFANLADPNKEKKKAKELEKEKLKIYGKSQQLYDQIDKQNTYLEQTFQNLTQKRINLDRRSTYEEHIKTEYLILNVFLWYVYYILFAFLLYTYHKQDKLKESKNVAIMVGLLLFPYWKIILNIIIDIISSIGVYADKVNNTFSGAPTSVNKMFESSKDKITSCTQKLNEIQKDNVEKSKTLSPINLSNLQPKPKPVAIDSSLPDKSESLKLPIETQSSNQLSNQSSTQLSGGKFKKSRKSKFNKSR